MLDTTLSSILYAFSGYLFGIFACRQSILAYLRLRAVGRHTSFLERFCLIFINLIVIAILCIVFPIWLYSRTAIGGFVYLATLLYYANKSRG